MVAVGYVDVRPNCSSKVEQMLAKHQVLGPNPNPLKGNGYGVREYSVPGKEYHHWPGDMIDGEGG